MRNSNKIFDISNLSKALIALILLLTLLGALMQYSAGGGDFFKYSAPYLIKLFLGFIVLIIIARIDLKIIFLLTNFFYYFSLFLLVVVTVVGSVRLGAQRWLNLGFFVIQPAELMKIAIILMLAKYFHTFSVSQVGKLKFYIQPLILVAIPTLLILKQPDLGTAIVLVLLGAVIFFLSGFRLKYFVIISTVFLMMLPILWFSLHDYQKNRILTFLNPDRDPLGAGYHIIQSKIAIGSGGLLGKGFLQGTQAQLDFLPEKHTDFIFTLIAEEFGFLGNFLIILIYSGMITIMVLMSEKCTYRFGQYVIAGIASMFFIYIFINIGMVSGLLPVVGIPLPFLSYGGTALISNMIAFGLVFNIDNNSSNKS